jgi:hypothetical protein
VSGGLSNEAAGKFSTVGGGQGNLASGGSSIVAGGNNNNAASLYATVGGGFLNAASTTNATVGGGTNNAASGVNSIVPGGEGAAASHYGEMAFAGGRFSAIGGSAQTSLYTLRQETTSATVAELFLDGSAERLTVAVGRALAFDILVVAKTAAGQSAGYIIRGVIKNVGGATSFVGTPNVITLDEDNAAWDVAIQADNTNDALVINVTGAAGTTIRWVASVRSSEVLF